MSVIHVTKETFAQEVLQSDKPVLVDFYATWCGPCRMVSPILDEISQEREDIKICKINIDEEPALASQYDVMSIPTFLVFQNGEKTNQALGAMPKNRILELL